MKALAWFGPEDVRLIEAPVPDITEPDDVILKVTALQSAGLISIFTTARL
jgi:threonine dehydrogenase-like Zn-dependent dehydrogenase